jgi:hypothetical protein
MIQRPFLAGILLLVASNLIAQKTITSTGDNNTNVNANVVVIIPQTSPSTKKILKKKAKEITGSSEQWEGLLVPATDKIDAERCGSLNTTLVVVAGKNIFKCAQLPCNIIRTKNKELLWVSGKKNALLVDARVLKADGTIIASVEKDKFYVNRNQTYRSPNRPDSSTIEVFDQKGNRVLWLRYANRSTLLIEGEFNDGFGNDLSVSERSIMSTSGRFRQTDNCMDSGPEQFKDGDSFTSINGIILGGLAKEP